MNVLTGCLFKDYSQNQYNCTNNIRNSVIPWQNINDYILTNNGFTMVFIGFLDDVSRRGIQNGKTLYLPVELWLVFYIMGLKMYLFYHLFC